MKKIHYLGHIILKKTIFVDLKKIEDDYELDEQ